MVKKILIVLILLPFLLLAFAPKKELYYLLEKRLATQDIVISGEQISTNPFGLSLEHPVFYVKGVKVATAKTVSLWSLLLYTHMRVEGLSVDPSLKNFVPPAVDDIELTHSMLHPTQIVGVIRDPSLAGDTTIDLKERTVGARLTRLPTNSPLKRYLKHSKGGWDYEKRF